MKTIFKMMLIVPIAIGMLFSCSTEQTEEFITADAKAKTSISFDENQETTLNPVYIEDFTDVSDWTFIDSDGDGRGWEQKSMFGRDGMRSQTSTKSGNLYIPDNWMISPAIEVGNSNRLKWDVRLPWWDATQEKYLVCISTGNTINDFLSSDVIYFENMFLKYTPSYTLREIDISQFQGQTIYVAFRHYASFGSYELHIDNMVVDENLGHTGTPRYPDGVDPETLNYTYTYIAGDSFAIGNRVKKENISKNEGIYMVSFNYKGQGYDYELVNFNWEIK